MAARSDDDQEAAPAEAETETEPGGAEVAGESQADGEKRRRRRGRRGGRRSRNGRDGEAAPSSESATPFQAEGNGLEPPQQGEWEPRESQLSPPEQDLGEPDHSGSYQREDAEPRVERHHAEVAQEREPHRPVSEPEAAPIAPPPPMSPPAAPRRGSTVREAAPTSFGFGGEFSTPAPVPQAEPEPPAQSSVVESEDVSRPRRAGWWSKRVLGKG
jgi:ribonuclease E